MYVVVFVLFVSYFCVYLIYLHFWYGLLQMLSSKDLNFVGYTYKNFEIVNDYQVPGIGNYALARILLCMFYSFCLCFCIFCASNWLRNLSLFSSKCPRKWIFYLSVSQKEHPWSTLTGLMDFSYILRGVTN